MPELVSLGIIVVDVWARPTEGFPLGGTLALVDEIGLGLGGCASNCAVDYTRLGGQAVAMGCVGQDLLGDIALRVLSDSGVELSVRRVPDVPTSATLVGIAADGERSFLHAPGASGAIDPDQLDMDLIRSADVLALMGVLVMPGFDGEPQARVLAEAQAAGVTTVVDTVYDGAGRWMELVRPVLPHTDIFLPSVNEARHLTGRQEPAEMAAALLEEGPGVVGIKLGPEGCYLRDREQELRLPAYPVQVVDGTGAGDAFVAGFIYGWRRGWTLENAGRFANAVGSLGTTAVGTTAGVRSYEETARCLAEWEGRPWKPS